MKEYYQAIEKAIQMAGYKEPISGEDIYNEICDEVENKEPGAYIFMSKKSDDTFFEYKIQVYEEQFNLSVIDIHSPNHVYHVDFD